MHIAVPREIKNQEYRVGLIPSGVRELVSQGHQVTVEHHCGAGIGFTDEDYRAAGASIEKDPGRLFGNAELIIKVKEPQPTECQRLRRGQILFTYLHLAPDPRQAEGLLTSECSAIAYETVTDSHGALPLLAPMSEVAGRLATQAGAHCLEKAQGGKGILLGGVPGVAPGRVVVLGGGVVGLHAARMAMGLGAQVTLFDRSLPRLKTLEEQFGPQLQTRYSTRESVEQALLQADLVIGAVLIPGAAAPKLVTREQLSRMQAGTVLVDVAIDQGGCFETSHPTTHDDPTFVVDDIVHYCVANMPGAVARTSTEALTNATLPYIQKLADQGLKALKQDPGFLAGLNVHQGHVTCEPVATALDLPYQAPESLI